MTIFRRPCLHMEGNHAQMKPTLQFRACYTRMRIREPTSRSKSAQAQEKTHFRQSQKQTQRSEGQMSSLTHLTFGEHHKPRQGAHKESTGRRWGQTASERGRPNPWVTRPLSGLNQAQLSPVVSLCIPYADPGWYHPES